MNDIIREEIRHQQARRRAKAELEHVEKIRRERALARKLVNLDQKLNRKPTLLQRLWAPVAESWELMWAVVFLWPEMLTNLCLEKGWLEEV